MEAALLSQVAEHGEERLLACGLPRGPKMRMWHYEFRAQAEIATADGEIWRGVVLRDVSAT
jgi:hypothetical protein